MALLLVNGNYVKVTEVSVDGKRVVFDRYRSADQRNAWKAGTEDHDYDNPVHESEYVAEHLDDALAAMADSSVSIADNITRAGYAALKRIARFQDAVDA